jgi:hypothetical protein
VEEVGQAYETLNSSQHAQPIPIMGFPLECSPYSHIWPIQIQSSLPESQHVSPSLCDIQSPNNAQYHSNDYMASFLQHRSQSLSGNEVLSIAPPQVSAYLNIPAKNHTFVAGLQVSEDRQFNSEHYYADQTQLTNYQRRNRHAYGSKRRRYVNS